jgi:hypothetical protein
MKRSNDLIADFPAAYARTSDKSSGQPPHRPRAQPGSQVSSVANLAGFRARRQHPHQAPAVAPFYVETEAA